MLGSVRGAAGNGGPYRDPTFFGWFVVPTPQKDALLNPSRPPNKMILHTMI